MSKKDMKRVKDCSASSTESTETKACGGKCSKTSRKCK